jgi:hypothetical protein
MQKVPKNLRKNDAIRPRAIPHPPFFRANARKMLRVLKRWDWGTTRYNRAVAGESWGFFYLFLCFDTKEQKIKKKRCYPPTGNPTPAVFSGQRTENASHFKKGGTGELRDANVKEQ